MEVHLFFTWVIIPSTAHRPFAKPPDNIASMPLLSNNNMKTCRKVNFNGQNKMGRPVKLHSYSKDGRPDRTVTMRWITSNMYSKDNLTVSI